MLKISIISKTITPCFQSKRAVDPNEPGAKPACVKTHLRSVIIIPEMVGAVVGIYNGKGKFLISANQNLPSKTGLLTVFHP